LDQLDHLIDEAHRDRDLYIDEPVVMVSFGFRG